MKQIDVLLVGAGIMGATLGVLLKQLDPDLSVVMVDRLAAVGGESTDAWHNAGTGHAAYCELNYTPQRVDGNIDPSKALAVNAAFGQSLQWWAHLVQQGILPSSFIHATPHISFVWGEENTRFLRQRHALLSQHPAFATMDYSEDPAVLQEWMPLVLEGRDLRQPLAATRVPLGTDVNFGALASHLVAYLQRFPDFGLLLGHQVQTLRQQRDGSWLVRLGRVGDALDTHSVQAKFVFLGAGGGALPLLQLAGVSEARGYAGFPVSGQWLVCQRPQVTARHHAKVYGKAAIGAPPMSVPHLDTRVIGAERALLFGPFAGFTTRFLKQGGISDLFASIRLHNWLPLMQVGMDNRALVRYLLSETLQSHAQRMQALRAYFPHAAAEDWQLVEAGIRVQIIKRGADGRGKLEFGTEVLATRDGTLAALLGASPGASVSVAAMLQVLERCFAERLRSPAWQGRLRAMLPTYGVTDPLALAQAQQEALAVLGVG